MDFETLRATEFRRLDESSHVYLDYTGSGLYAASQLRRHEELLEHHVLGNPHSENPASAEATRLVERSRAAVLDFFGADPAEWVVIFTANASASLKLVGEAFPFAAGSRFTLLRDAHNSVNGICRYAEDRGAQVTYLPLSRDLRLAPDAEIPRAGEAPALFSFPAQSNFSGVQHPLSLAEEARARGYRVLLDAAAYVPTNRLDLGSVAADFVAISFYKMFGYPTGVGALLATRGALGELCRPWFAGGTVEFVSVQSRMHRLRLGAEAFEDGTPNFLGIAAVPAGLEVLESVGMEHIHERVHVLTGRLLDSLSALRHSDGGPLVDLYGPPGTDRRGGTVAFNVRDRDGGIVPFGVVERAASEAGISVRGGCFCNPGAAEVAFDTPAERTLRCVEEQALGHFDLRELASCLDHDVPVGALRASLGIASNEDDVERLARFLERYRDVRVADVAA